MGKHVLLLVVWLVAYQAYAQVGIDVAVPEATLDINGDLKIRTVGSGTTADSILVSDNGVVKKIPQKLSFVKGGFGSSGLALSLINIGGTNERMLPFNTTTFDENSDFNITTHKFTAPLNGIYDVSVIFTYTTLLSLSSIRLSLVKENNVGVYARESSVQVNGLGIGASVNLPVNTLVKLQAGEKIFFTVDYSSISSLSSFSSTGSYFSIHQVK